MFPVTRSCLLTDSLTGFLLPTVHPFASEEEFKATVDIVRKFQEGVGKELHQKLLQRARTKKNWVREATVKILVVHMSSLIPGINWLCFYPPVGRMVVRRSVPGGPHPLSAECELRRPGAVPRALVASCRGSSPAEGQYKHLARTTVLGPDPHVRHPHSSTSRVFVVCSAFTISVCKYVILISFLSSAYFSEKLAPQKAGKTALDMDQFRMLFCTCKVPGVKKDTIRNYFKTGRINMAVIFNL